MSLRILGSALLLMACTGDGDTDTDLDTDIDTDTDTDTDTDGTACGDDWSATGFSDSSHTKAGDLDYDLVFDDTAVRRLDIIICPSDWVVMQSDLTTLSRSAGQGSFPDENPVYVPVHISYEGQSWPWVGMRFKGNSTLWSAFQQGNGKLPFRLHFDKYEDDYPSIDNQRFHGFKELKFGNNAMDDSLIRDKMMSDTFRDAGVAAAKGAFTRIYVDVGEGPQYWGLYTMYEDPTNALLDDWFGTDDGNMYKADGDAATLASFNEDDFEAKTNEDETDWSDVKALVDALASTSEGEAWRTELESAFDARGYLRALAINQIVGNWDTYGVMTHNYYLYADPDLAGPLVYVPWDFNESYLHGSGRRGALSVALDEVGNDWPLLRRTMDDDVYRAVYKAELDSVMADVLSIDVQTERAERYHDLIAPYVVGEDGEVSGYTHLRNEAAFTNSVPAVINAVVEGRRQAEAFTP